MCFPHEKLLVYQRSLDFFGDIQCHITSWSRQYPFVDHLDRATESVLFNLAEGVRLFSVEKKVLTLDYAIGSVLECAACLDIAVVKGVLVSAVAVEKKGVLIDVCKMLVGLRNSWRTPHVAEASEVYKATDIADGKAAVFHHETMDRYVIALDYYRWFVTVCSGRRRYAGFEKAADTLATRIVLNIAESNGRYASLSRQSFLDTANAAAAKSAVMLDMGVGKGVLSNQEVDSGKGLLLRVGQMTARKDYSDR